MIAIPVRERFHACQRLQRLKYVGVGTLQYCPPAVQVLHDQLMELGYGTTVRDTYLCDVSRVQTALLRLGKEAIRDEYPGMHQEDWEAERFPPGMNRISMPLFGFCSFMRSTNPEDAREFWAKVFADIWGMPLLGTGGGHYLRILGPWAEWEADREEACR